MSINSFRRQGDPARTGFTIGHAPLALRGIRFVEGDGSAPPAAPPAGGQAPAAQPPAAPAASPTDVAAMLAALGKGTPPAAPAPQAPAPTVQGFTPEQVQKLLADNTAAQQALEAAQTAAQQAQKERDEFQAQVTQFAREKAVTTAADGKANAALLLDSAKFQAAVKDIDLTDGAKLGAAVEQFVKDNPAYAATPAPALPATSGGTPAGGSPTKPNTLEGAIAARLAG